MKKSARRKSAKPEKTFLFQGKGLSIRQPWASAIAFAGKDIENRSWQTHYRGPVAIHASATFQKGELERNQRQAPGGPQRSLIDWIEMGRQRYQLADDAETVPTSHVIAIAMLSDCTQHSKSIWHTPGYWGWALQGVVPIKPIPMKGTLGLWDCRFRYEPLRATARPT